MCQKERHALPKLDGGESATMAPDSQQAHELAAMGGGEAMMSGAVVEVEESRVGRLGGPHQSWVLTKQGRRPR